MTNEFRVAGKLEAWCGKCKLMLWHTVETMTEGKPNRVHCNSCNSQHAYKPYAPGESPREVRSQERAASSGPKPGMAKASHYDSLLVARDKSLAKAYSPKTKYAPEELLTHPTFGLGIVTSLKDTTKVEVLFADGPRVLVHGR
jgi:hypothetical protein